MRAIRIFPSDVLTTAPIRDKMAAFFHPFKNHQRKLSRVPAHSFVRRRVVRAFNRDFVRDERSLRDGRRLVHCLRAEPRNGPHHGVLRLSHERLFLFD